MNSLGAAAGEDNGGRSAIWLHNLIHGTCSTGIHVFHFGAVLLLFRLWKFRVEASTSVHTQQMLGRRVAEE